MERMLVVVDPAVHVHAATGARVALDRRFRVDHAELRLVRRDLELVARNDTDLREQRAYRLPALRATADVIVRNLRADRHRHLLRTAFALERAPRKFFAPGFKPRRRTDESRLPFFPLIPGATRRAPPPGYVKKATSSIGTAPKGGKRNWCRPAKGTPPLRTWATSYRGPKPELGGDPEPAGVRGKLLLCREVAAARPDGLRCALRRFIRSSTEERLARSMRAARRGRCRAPDRARREPRRCATNNRSSNGTFVTRWYAPQSQNWMIQVRRGRCERFGPLRCMVSEENTSTSPAPSSTGSPSSPPSSPT